MVNYYENITNDRVNMTNWNFFFGLRHPKNSKRVKLQNETRMILFPFEIYTSQCNWLMLYQLYVIACTYQSLDEINFSGVSFAGNDVF